MIICLVYIDILLIILSIVIYKNVIHKRQPQKTINKPFLKDSFEEKDLTDLTVKIFSVPYEKIGY